MRERIISVRPLVAALAVLFLGLGPAVGQQSNTGGSGGGPAAGGGSAAKPKSQLEDWLEKGLASHPDIKVAEAKLRTAAAELERTRSLVTQQVLSLHHGIEAQKIVVEKARLEMERVAELVKKAVVPQAELGKARSDVIAAEAKLAELQGQVNHMLGRDRTQTKQKVLNVWLESEGVSQPWDFSVDRRAVEAWVTARQAPVRGPMAERIRKALDRKMSFRCDDGTVEGILARLQKECPDLVIQTKGGVPKMVTGRADLQEVPVAAVLQWLEDSLQGCRLVVREYGILLAPEKDLPPGAVPLVEFWKGSSDKDGSKKPSGPPQK